MTSTHATTAALISVCQLCACSSGRDAPLARSSDAGGGAWDAAGAGGAAAGLAGGATVAGQGGASAGTGSGGTAGSAAGASGAAAGHAGGPVVAGQGGASAGTAGSGGMAGSAAGAGAAGVSGSSSVRHFDVVGAGLPAKGGYPPSIAWTLGSAFRLDLRDDGTAAIWTSVGGYPAPVVSHPGETLGWSSPLSLPPKGALTLFAGAQSQWAFAVDGAGNPSAALATVTGEVVCHQSAHVFSNFAGNVGPDVTSPTFSVATSPSVPGVSFPWEGAWLAASEGVDASTWIAASSATVDGAPAALEGAAVKGTLETDRLMLSPAAWNSRSGAKAELSTSGVADASGNVGQPAKGSVSFVDVGPSSPQLVFDGTAKPFVSGFVQPPAGDPACEPGAGCLTAHFAASANPPVLAGRVAVTTQKLLRFRLAVTNLVGGDWCAPGDVLVMVRIVSPDGVLVEQALWIAAGGWSDHDIGILPSSGDFGVQLTLPSPWCQGYYCGPTGAVYDLAVSRIVPM